MANLVGPDFAAGFLDLHSFRDHIATIAPLLPPSMRPLTDQVAQMGDDELAFYEKTFLDMQKNIFYDASTMHEAYLADGMAGITELQAAGLLKGPNQSEQQAAVSSQTTLQAWQDIDTGIRTGRTDLVDSGNEALLYREQHDTIQRSYDQMRDHEPTGEALTTMLGIVGDASIPDTKTRGQYEGGFSVPLDYVPSLPGVQGQIETFNIPTTNISEFDVRGITWRTTPCPPGRSSRTATPSGPASSSAVPFPTASTTDVSTTASAACSTTCTTRSSYGSEPRPPPGRDPGDRDHGRPARRLHTRSRAEPQHVQPTRRKRARRDPQRSAAHSHVHRGRRRGLGPHRAAQRRGLRHRHERRLVVAGPARRVQLVWRRGTPGAVPPAGGQDG
jgi:hypothetical protein